MKSRIWCNKYQNWCDLVCNFACKSYFTTGGCFYAKTIIYLEKREEKTIGNNLKKLDEGGATNANMV